MVKHLIRYKIRNKPATVPLHLLGSLCRGRARQPPGGAQGGCRRLNLAQFTSIWFKRVRILESRLSGARTWGSRAGPPGRPEPCIGPALALPIRDSVLVPMGEVGFVDGLGGEMGGEDGLDFGQMVEPGEEVLGRPGGVGRFCPCASSRSLGSVALFSCGAMVARMRQD